MGLWSYAMAGAGFLITGALEIASIPPYITPSPPLSPLQPPPTKPLPSSASEQTLKNLSSYSAASICASLLSLLFILNSIVSIFSSSINSIAFVLQLEVISVSSLFLLYSTLRLFFQHSPPSPVVTSIGLFAFAEEFLLFYLQRKDPSGVENRYFDLLLLPIAICFFSCVLDLGSEKSGASAIVRGVGLISQGAWFIQMGVSFFSRFVSHGCYLQEKSRGDYTLRCKEHFDFHRGRAIATLQFNCHLAVLVAVSVFLYSGIRWRNSVKGEDLEYMPIFAEMQEMEGETLFTLNFEEESEDRLRDGHADKVKEIIVSNSEVDSGSFHT